MYAGNRDYPAEFASLEPVRIIRGQEFAILHLQPFRYHPAGHLLSVYPDLRVTVSFPGKAGAIPRRLENRNFRDLFRRTALNADVVLAAEETPAQRLATPAGEGSGARAVRLPDYRAAGISGGGQSLAAWKRKCGFRTYVATTGETGATATAIRDFIQNATTPGTPAPPMSSCWGTLSISPPTMRRSIPTVGT